MDQLALVDLGVALPHHHLFSLWSLRLEGLLTAGRDPHHPLLFHQGLVVDFLAASRIDGTEEIHAVVLHFQSRFAGPDHYLLGCC